MEEKDRRSKLARHLAEWMRVYGRVRAYEPLNRGDALHDLARAKLHFGTEQHAGRSRFARTASQHRRRYLTAAELAEKRKRK